MRTQVIFRHPAPFVPAEEDSPVLSAKSAGWFAALLEKIDGLSVDADVCQEDWGAVFFAARGGRKFWVGLSAAPDGEGWLVHLHHGSFAWLQRFSAAGTGELQRLAADLHRVLAAESAITAIAWYEKDDAVLRDSHPTP
jgi:hypothetical protein